MIAGIYGFLVGTWYIYMYNVESFDHLLLVFWGAAIVFFLAKFINLHNANTQGFWVELSSQIENGWSFLIMSPRRNGHVYCWLCTGLFTATGLGLFPSRVLDTYRSYPFQYLHASVIDIRFKA